MLNFSELPYAFGRPQSTAQLKQQLTDFQVEELLSFSLSGEGEHLWVWLEKHGENTDWAAQQLAKWANIRIRDVGYAGHKDRHGVTRQWFSLRLPGQENPDVTSFESETLRIVKHQRHQRKLQTGGLQGNRFVITLRDFNGERAKVEQRLQLVAEQGVPNYFGEQRFGRNGHNLVMAQRLFDGELTRLKPAKRGLIISAARSFLFNQILAERIKASSWNQAWSGDVFQLEGSDKWFVDDGSADLADRVTTLDIHPTGALVGAGDSAALKQTLELEQSVLANHQAWCLALTELGLKQDRRALRVFPKNLMWDWLDSQTLQLSFELRAGSYATMVLREILQATEGRDDD